MLLFKRPRYIDLRKKYIKQFTRPSMVTFVERLMSEKLFFGKFVKICKKAMLVRTQFPM